MSLMKSLQNNFFWSKHGKDVQVLSVYLYSSCRGVSFYKPRVFFQISWFTTKSFSTFNLLKNCCRNTGFTWYSYDTLCMYASDLKKAKSKKSSLTFPLFVGQKCKESGTVSLKQTLFFYFANNTNKHRLRTPSKVFSSAYPKCLAE